jgi:hypothetical protein
MDTTGATLWPPIDIATQGNGVVLGTNFGGWFQTALAAGLVLAVDGACQLGIGVDFFYGVGILP